MDNKNTDTGFMARAVEIAQCGLGGVSPNPLVGAVIVGSGGGVLGEGFHRQYGESHAEVNAVGAVADRAQLEGATMYVTLEPCSHYGKTPPCADLLVECGFGRVVIGCEDPYVEVRGRGIKRLREAGIEVEVGVLEKQCWEMNRRFMTSQTKHRPYIILKWAQTSDHYLDTIRDTNTPPVWMTGSDAKKLVHQWRTQEDAIMVGRRTVELDNPQLTARETQGRNPLRVIVSSNNNTLKTAQLKAFDNQADTIIVSGGVEKIMKELHHRKVQSVIIEGGAQLLSSFIDANLWDEARVFTTAHPLRHYYPHLPNVTGIPAPTTRMADHQHPQEQMELQGSLLQVFRNHHL